MSLLNKQGSLTLSFSLSPFFSTVPTTCDAVDVFLCTVSSQRSVNEQQHSRYTHYAVHTHREQRARVSLQIRGHFKDKHVDCDVDTTEMLNLY